MVTSQDALVQKLCSRVLELVQGVPELCSRGWVTTQAQTWGGSECGNSHPEYGGSNTAGVGGHVWLRHRKPQSLKRPVSRDLKSGALGQA